MDLLSSCILSQTVNNGSYRREYLPVMIPMHRLKEMVMRREQM